MKKLFAILLAVVICLSLAACGDNETVAQTGDTQSNDVPGETLSGTNETMAPNEQTEGPLVFENFVSGVLVDESENQLKLEVTSIDITDKGLEIHYNADRQANDSYSNYYTFSKVVLDGCVVEGEYYTDDQRHDTMGKHAGEADGDTYYLIPNIVLNAIGFDGSWTSLEITFWAGYSANNTVTEEFRQDFILYSGQKAEIPIHELSEAAKIGTIYADEEVKIVVTGVEMFTGNLGRVSGQNVYVYTQSSNTDWTAWMSVTVGEQFVVAEDAVLVKAGETCVQKVEFRQSNIKKFNYEEADMTNAVWKITLLNRETDQKTEYQIPIDLSVNK